MDTSAPAVAFWSAPLTCRYLKFSKWHGQVGKLLEGASNDWAARLVPCGRNDAVSWRAQAAVRCWCCIRQLSFQAHINNQMNGFESWNILKYLFSTQITPPDAGTLRCKSGARFTNSLSRIPLQPIATASLSFTAGAFRRPLPPRIKPQDWEPPRAKKGCIHILSLH